MRQPFSGTAERIFMKLLPNDTGKNGVWNVVPPLGESRSAAWRMANVDDLHNLRYDSCAITRGRHARRLCLQMHEPVNGFSLISLLTFESSRSQFKVRTDLLQGGRILFTFFCRSSRNAKKIYKKNPLKSVDTCRSAASLWSMECM